MSIERILWVVAASSLVSGCNLFSRLNSDCHGKQDYQRAAQAAPLIVPPGLDSPNTQGALTIPTVDLAPPPPGPHDACLDIPPRYKPAPSNKAASSG
jgi:uncharacterized lipoprotein